MDGIAKAKDRGVKFGRKRELTDKRVEAIKALREAGETVPSIIKRQQGERVSGTRLLMHSSTEIEVRSLSRCLRPLRWIGLHSFPNARAFGNSTIFSQCEGLGKLAILSQMAHR